MPEVLDAVNARSVCSLGTYGQSGTPFRPFSSFAVSLCVHGAAVVLFLLFAPQTVFQSVVFMPRDHTLLVPVPESEPAPATPRPQVPAPRITVPQAKLLLPTAAPAPRPVLPEAPQLPAAPATAPAVAAAPVAPAPPAPVVPAPQVRTNVFSGAQPALPPMSVPQRATASAGFDTAPKITIPSTPGGNPVASSGFDSAAPAQTASKTGSVRTGAFGQTAVATTARAGTGRTAATGFDARPTSAPTPQAAAPVRQSGFEEVRTRDTARPTAAPPPVQIQPVEILDKPKPVYTEEARQKKIEGAVLLDVIFGASGQIRIVGVVRGLGYGLDEAAMAAARRIRFKPATRAGVPVDQRATLHVTFEMTK